MKDDPIVRAVIVEDESLMRGLLRDFASALNWLEVIGEAADGATAVHLIDTTRPDLVFLDVHLPEFTGLEVLDRVAHNPAVIFTTAYDRYAVPAFELEAIDYLIKPFGRVRFMEAVDRARARLKSAGDLPPARERERAALIGAPLNRIFVEECGRILPVRTVRVTRFEATGDYVRVHTDDRTYLVRLTLGELGERLDPRSFVRVHRSHIVNVDRIRYMERYDDRRLVLCMDDGSKVLASRSGSSLLRNIAS